MPTTTTTYNLRAITDESITKIHLGAVEKANVTFCGVKLLVAGDTRFGGKYAKGNGYTSSTDLGTVDCGACKRTSAWRIFAGTGSATIGIPAHAASKPKAGRARDRSGRAAVDPHPQERSDPPGRGRGEGRRQARRRGGVRQLGHRGRTPRRACPESGPRSRRRPTRSSLTSSLPSVPPRPASELGAGRAAAPLGRGVRDHRPAGMEGAAAGRQGRVDHRRGRGGAD